MTAVADKKVNVMNELDTLNVCDIHSAVRC